MAFNFEEKRRFPRLNLHSPIRYQFRGSSEFANAVSDNVSAGGLSFTSGNFIAPATPLMLEVKVLSRIIHPIAKVAWSFPLPHSNRNKVGVEFVEFDRIEKNFLSDFIEMQLSQA